MSKLQRLCVCVWGVSVCCRCVTVLGVGARGTVVCGSGVADDHDSPVHFECSLADMGGELMGGVDSVGVRGGAVRVGSEPARSSRGSWDGGGSLLLLAS